MDELRKYTLVPAGTYTADETHATHQLLCPHRRFLAVLDLTNAAAAAGDKLDVYVDLSPDNGVTWINALHFTQILGNGADALRYFAVLEAITPGTAVIDATADCAAGVVRPTIFGNAARARTDATNGGTGTQTFTYSVVLYGLD